MALSSVLRIHKLDGLRGIFSLMVVIYHYPLQYLPDYIHNFFLVGKSYLFVDFFFVLSGFVITLNYNTLITNANALHSFMAKRFVRLYPLLFYTTLLYCLLQVSVKILLPQFAANKDSFMPTFLDTIDTLLLLNSTPLITINTLGMNYPSWSISAEMISYLFFGLLVLLAWGKGKNVIMAASIIGGMIFLIWMDPRKDEINFRFIRGIVAFNIGYFVYHISNRRQFKVPNAIEGVLVVLLMVLLYTAQLLDETMLHAVMEHAIMPLFFGVSIIAFIHSNGAVSRTMERGVFQYLGKISYSIYLNHAIVLLVLPLAVFKVMKVDESTGIEFIVAPLTVLAVVAYSHITYNLIELRLGRAIKNWMSASGSPKSYPVHPVVSEPVADTTPVRKSGESRR